MCRDETVLTCVSRLKRRSPGRLDFFSRQQEAPEDLSAVGRDLTGRFAGLCSSGVVYFVERPSNRHEAVSQSAGAHS